MASAPPNRIDLYWRPGCGFCMALERQITKHGIEVTRHNIWDDPSAADHVRSVANGSETVPTVTIGDQSLVNPRINELVALIEKAAPDLLPEGYEAPDPSRIGRTIQRLLGG